MMAMIDDNELDLASDTPERALTMLFHRAIEGRARRKAYSVVL